VKDLSRKVVNNQVPDAPIVDVGELHVVICFRAIMLLCRQYQTLVHVALVTRHRRHRPVLST